MRKNGSNTSKGTKWDVGGGQDEIDRRAELVKIMCAPDLVRDACAPAASGASGVAPTRKKQKAQGGVNIGGAPARSGGEDDGHVAPGSTLPGRGPGGDMGAGRAPQGTPGDERRKSGGNDAYQGRTDAAEHGVDAGPAGGQAFSDAAIRARWGADRYAVVAPRPRSGAGGGGKRARVEPVTGEAAEAEAWLAECVDMR